MTKRQKAIKLALELYRFSFQMKSEPKSAWGIYQSYTFYAPGKIFQFRNIFEIEEMAKKIVRGAKC